MDKFISSFGNHGNIYSVNIQEHTYIWSIQDIDPLGDAVPPRHAVESDEEEDEFNPLSSNRKLQAAEDVDVKITGDIRNNRALVILTGDAGNFWSKGVVLGERKGAVMLNNVQVRSFLCSCHVEIMNNAPRKVGLIFHPSWTNATLLVSEATTRLPTWAMYKYAKSIIDSLKPSRSDSHLLFVSSHIQCVSIV